MDVHVLPLDRRTDWWVLNGRNNEPKKRRERAAQRGTLCKCAQENGRAVGNLNDKYY